MTYRACLFSLLLCSAFLAGSADPARADAWPECRATDGLQAPWNVTFGEVLTAPRPQASPGWTFGPAAAPGPVTIAAAAGFVASRVEQTAAPAAQRAVAIEYSDAYNVRRKIHFYASAATVPLFVTEYVLGQRLYDKTGDRGDSTGLHSGVAGAMGVLFGVNTVTGVWNLWEGRKNPTGRTKRIVHSLLMLGADAGFVATSALAPDDDEDGPGSSSGRSRHRAVAVTSMGIAAASYVIMLIGR